MLNEKRNHVNKGQVEKVVLVWTWERLEQALIKKGSIAVLKPWTADLTKKLTKLGLGGADATILESDM